MTPASRDRAAVEQDLAFERLQPLLVEFVDQGVPPAVLESMLFYFWFRSTAFRRRLDEHFFQKLERNWDAVMERVNQYINAWPERLADLSDAPK